MQVASEDYVEISLLLARYGNIIDNRDWGAMSQVFTDDLEHVPSADPARTRPTSLGDLVERWSEPTFHHPVGHHATNVLIALLGRDSASASCKGLAVEENGVVWSVTYDDELRRTPDGCRIYRRVSTIRPTRARPA